jgi:hypothetical protein
MVSAPSVVTTAVFAVPSIVVPRSFGTAAVTSVTFVASRVVASMSATSVPMLARSGALCFL